MKRALPAMILMLAGCSGAPEKPAGPSPVTTRGEIEVTARLLPYPPEAIVRKELYNYATVMKYELLSTQRGQVKTKTLYIAHYNPWKSRTEAADKFVKDVGGTLTTLTPGDTHQLALSPLDDAYMGALVNVFDAEKPEIIYFALWTEK